MRCDDVWLVEEADRRRRAASHAAADALSIVCPDRWAVGWCHNEGGGQEW